MNFVFSNDLTEIMISIYGIGTMDFMTLKLGALKKKILLAMF